MIEFAGRGILLDIEGTTSSVSFVFDVMFPYVRREVVGFLRSRWNDPAVQEACDLVARDAGQTSLAVWAGPHASLERRQALVVDEVLRQMNRDAKLTGLKQLQGLVWEAGFHGGELRAQVFDDVAPAIRRWRDVGREVRIYSSGSVQAQKLFFGHTEQGNLLDLFGGHYDTRVGPKREAASYQAIAADWDLPLGEILFLSDIPAELIAARQAGMQVGLCFRPGNATLPDGHGLPLISTFDSVRLV